MPSENYASGEQKVNSNQGVEKEDYLWIALGDIHDDISRLDEIAELKAADGIIVTGDMTFNGGVTQAERVLLAIEERNPHILAQIGNMDRAEVTDWLQEKKWNLHAQVRELLSDLCIFGVGGSTFTPFGTPSEYPETHFADWLDEAWQKARKWPKQILISHNPPKDTLCDVIEGGVHVGSGAVREFIEECQPDICICGHIHEAYALDSIGRTVVVNPGNFAAGGYVLIRSNKGKLSVELKKLDDTL